VAAAATRASFRLREGLELSYLRWGAEDGPTILLLHGGGLDATDWGVVAPELAVAGYRVIAPDLRGCGESEWDPEARYGVEQAFADVEEAVAQLELERFDLIGHSLGSVAACVYAARRSDRVRRCVMEDGGPADHTRPAALESPTIVFDSMDEAVASLRRAFPRGMPDWVPASRLKKLPDGRVTWRSDIAGRVRWSAAGGEPLIPGLWPFVEALRVPTLVVRGGEGTLFPRENAERMCKLNEQISLVTVEGAGHLVHCERPEEFTRVVLEFLV
jgi:pimeloyl-ACP methyl ester carboxylesterase